MASGQLIEQRALHRRAREAGGFLLELALDQAAQLVDAFEAERLGEIVVRDEIGSVLHRLDDASELGVLPGEVCRRIVSGERHSDRALIAGLHADELFFKTGDEAARAKLKRLVCCGAAIEGNAIDRTGEIDDQLVAIGSHGAFRCVVKTFLASGDAQDRFLNLLVAHFNRQALKLEAVDGRCGDFGQHFQAHGQLGVLALLIAFAQRNVGLGGRAQALFSHKLVHRFTDRGFQRLLVKRGAVHLAHEVRGHLAGAEAGHAHLRRDLLDFALDKRGDIIRGDGQGVGALQALVAGFDDLHL